MFNDPLSSVKWVLRNHESVSASKKEFRLPMSCEGISAKKTKNFWHQFTLRICLFTPQAGTHPVRIRRFGKRPDFLRFFPGQPFLIYSLNTVCLFVCFLLKGIVSYVHCLFKCCERCVSCCNALVPLNLNWWCFNILDCLLWHCVVWLSESWKGSGHKLCYIPPQKN